MLEHMARLATGQDLNMSAATRELRAHLRYSQQAMASFLGVSMGAVRNYECGAVEPEAGPIAKYLAAADDAGLDDLVDFFYIRLQRRLGLKNHEILLIPKSAWMK